MEQFDEQLNLLILMIIRIFSSNQKHQWFENHAIINHLIFYTDLQMYCKQFIIDQILIFWKIQPLKIFSYITKLINAIIPRIMIFLSARQIIIIRQRKKWKKKDKNLAIVSISMLFHFTKCFFLFLNLNYCVCG